MVELGKELGRVADQLAEVRECLQELLKTTTELRQRMGGDEAWNQGDPEVKWIERPSALPPPKE